MKKTVLLSVLATLISTQIHADTSLSAPTQTQTPDTSTTTTAPDTGEQAPSTEQLNATQNTQQEINCSYKIPAGTKVIDQSLVLQWSEKATIQAFNFSPASLDTQLRDLHNCFTEQGWNSFNTALQKSGNIEAIKDQNLSVSSMVDGEGQVLEAKDNEWKVAFPLQVVYQNDKEKVTQLLNVTLTISRKIDGDLGINQMIASPRTPKATDQSNAPADTSTTSPETTDTQTPTPGTDSAAPTTNTDTTPLQPQNTDTSGSEDKSKGTSE